MSFPVQLLSIGTAVPPHVLNQNDVAEVAKQTFASRFSDFSRLSKVFDTSGIRTRFGVKPLEWYTQPMGWPERSAAYVDGACLLFIDAARKALDSAGLIGSDVDCVVTISSTGISTPSLEARTAASLGFRPDIERVPVFGLGCAGGVSGLSLASRLAAARPGSTILVVAVETCTLAFRMDQLTKANIVATALFGDGGAACVLRAGDAGMANIEMSGQHMWPDSLEIMGWSVDNEGFGVIFDRAIPPFARENLLPAINGILNRNSLEFSDIDGFVCHPGGAKVVDALEAAFSLGQGTLNDEREILAGYGNMSAPTVLFVLERALKRGLPERTLVTAMGPGFTVSCASLTRAA